MTGAARPLPDDSVERALLEEGFRVVAGVDEVGRGAWAGPVSVGVVVFRPEAPAPAGVRDSKEVAEEDREALYPLVCRWCRGWAVGHVGPDECDRLGMTAALRLAARRALGELRVRPDVLLLDGPFDYVSEPPPPAGGSPSSAPDSTVPEARRLAARHGRLASEDCLAPGPVPGPSAPAPAPAAGPHPFLEGAGGPSSPCPTRAVEGALASRDRRRRARRLPPVRTVVDGDASCVSIAAASIVAKVTRDRLMREMAESFPAFDFDRNKGYPSPTHRTALAGHGLSSVHRRSWAFVEGMAFH